MALIMEIMQTIAQPISELARWLEETYQVDTSETIAKWHELTGMNITVKEGEVSHNEVASLDVETSPKSKIIPKTRTVCQHIYSNGQKAGEQCTTKPKGGATFCSAHRPKNSVKKEKVPKESKKKEPKKVDKIDPEFESDSEPETKPVKAPKEPKKKEKVVVKKTIDSDASDIEGLSDPQPIVPLLRKKTTTKRPIKPKPQDYDTDEEHLDEDLNLSDN